MRNEVTSAVVLGAVLTAGCLSDVHSSRSWGSRPFEDGNPPAPTTTAPTFFAPMDLGPTVHQTDPPPPISGGHLAITPDGNTAVVADPDRDAVYLVSIAEGQALDASAVRTVPLSKYDEPGRVAIDHESSRAYVALRRGGAVVAIDLASGTKLWQVAACPMPRGIAWDRATSSVLVACVGGEIATIPAAGTFAATIRREDGITDLRDINVTKKGAVIVTTFRSPEVLTLAPMIGIADRSPKFRNFAGGPRTIAWRTLAIAAPATPADEEQDDELIMVSQTAGRRIVPIPDEYYAPEPDKNDVGPVTVVSGPDFNMPVPDAVLPVDIAVSSTKIAVVSAANGHSRGLPTVVVFDRPIGKHGDLPIGRRTFTTYPFEAQVTSVAFSPDGSKLVAFSREPAQLIVQDEKKTTHYTYSKVPLSNESREDTGHAVFHSNAGRGSACASCHAEGRDDGHAWQSTSLGARRTPSLIGTVANTAPYHWNGEARTMNELMRMTFTGRMGGPSLEPDQSEAMDKWLTKVPALVVSAPRDKEAAKRGKLVFETSTTAKCSTCHVGATLTNNATVSVGTRGGAYQVPSLIGVSLRAPYLHDGSRDSLSSVLATPHGGAVLTTEEASDVAVFLGTL